MSTQFKVLKEFAFEGNDKHVGEILDSADFKAETTEESIAELVQDGTLELVPEKTDEEKQKEADEAAAQKKADEDAAAAHKDEDESEGNVGKTFAPGENGTRHPLA